jgi:hypothetical protein
VRWTGRRARSRNSGFCSRELRISYVFVRKCITAPVLHARTNTACRPPPRARTHHPIIRALFTSLNSGSPAIRPPLAPTPTQHDRSHSRAWLPSLIPESQKRETPLNSRSLHKQTPESSQTHATTAQRPYQSATTPIDTNTLQKPQLPLSNTFFSSSQSQACNKQPQHLSAAITHNTRTFSSHQRLNTNDATKDSNQSARIYTPLSGELHIKSRDASLNPTNSRNQETSAITKNHSPLRTSKAHTIISFY